MTNNDLGCNKRVTEFQKKNGFEKFGIARVSAVHKERYRVRNADGERSAELLGNLRFTAQSSLDFPAVGDWVVISEFDEDKALIHALVPRQNYLERQTAGKHGEKQLIAANIDMAFIIQSVGHDFNLNRLERYLTICNKAGIDSMILLNKTDLIDESELKSLTGIVNKRLKDTEVLAISNQSGKGLEKLRKIIRKGHTYCLLGSSGVGKSTLINKLSAEELMKTGNISDSTSKGKHVTSHRELFVLKNGGIIIDNPGMREVGIADAGTGLEETFEIILEYAGSCKYKDCSHTVEKGCAVIEAVENGEIDGDAYRNYIKMEKEKDHFESTVAEKRQKDKDFGKMMKNFKKDVKKVNDKFKE